MQPDLLELKSLQNLKEVHKAYIDFYNKYDSWEKVCCPICKNDRYKEIFILDKFRYVECKNCLSVYNNPQMVLSVSLDYDIYRNKLVKPSKVLRTKLSEIKYQQIQEHTPKKGRLLDVGCGMGTLLKVFEKHGWKTEGVDPDSPVKRKNISKVYFESFWSKEIYDCITFYGVLEHINHPQIFIDKALTLLKPNGLIVFEVPSADSFLMEYIKKQPFSPYRFIEHGRHLSFFSREAIKSMCKGLKIIDIKTVGFDAQTIWLSNSKDLLEFQDTINSRLQGDHYRVYVKQ